MNRIVIPLEVEKLATLSVDAAFAVHKELIKHGIQRVLNIGKS